MPTSTHDVVVGNTEVIKRYRSWDRGEPDREWRGLDLLHTYAPFLAPTPLERRVAGNQPLIVMSRLEGVALGTRPLNRRQVASLATAVNTLHSAVPAAEVATLPRRVGGAAEILQQLRRQLNESHEGLDAKVRQALAASADWLQSREATEFGAPALASVFAQGDGNLGNFMWDGKRCQVVDFEDSGAGDQAFEIADLIEHVSSWLTGSLEPEAFLRHLALEAPLAVRVQIGRRLMAAYWLVMLLPANPAHHRNEPGSVDRQAERVLQLLT